MNRPKLLLGPRNWYYRMHYVPHWRYDAHGPKRLVASAPALINRTHMPDPHHLPNVVVLNM
jgi:hypothetical protein